MPRKLLASSLPAVKVSRRGATRLKDGHVWVYRSDVISAAGVAPGAMVGVTDDRGKPLGTALYSSASQIAIRMISSRPVADLPSLLAERIAAAIAYRERVVENTDAYRVIFSEADFLPGLIVDRYNDVISLQILTQAMDQESVRAGIVSGLKKLKPAGIVERVDPRIRELEQLPARESGLIGGNKSSTEFAMNGVRFRYDGLHGQKTGAFLDQRENYAAAARYASGTALDVFCYQGGFGLHLAEHCSSVTGVDSSREALEVAEENAKLNGREIEWMEANAFDLLRDYATVGKHYDTIVLDPPAFAKSKQNLDTALRGYKELNLRALKMLPPGGTLITCSCSYHVSGAAFLEVVSEAGRDAHRSLRLLESRVQAKDHPILLGVPETGYLRCLILSVSN
jgi:23S rRNA (cytosine1962-C5)-methyltransferase